MKSVALLIACLLTLVAAAHAGEDERQRARSLGEEGDALFDRGKYEAALDRYRQAAALVDVPTLGLREARTLEKLGRLVEAAERYRKVTRTQVPADAPAGHHDAVALAREEQAALEPRVPSLTAEFAGDRRNLEVTLDGAPFSSLGEKHPVDPGRHRLEARRGKGVFIRDIDVSEGAAITVTIELPAESPAPPERAPPPGLNPAWPIGWTALGLGAAGLVVGAVTGGLAIDKHDELKVACGDALDCLPPWHDDIGTYNDLRIASAVGLYAGAALAITGIVLVVWSALDEEEHARFGPLSASF